MKTWKEQVDSLKAKFTSRITAESSQEEIEAVNADIAEIDALDTAHNEVVTENAKLKDTIVRMVSTEGSGDRPGNDEDGSKPLTIEECMTEIQKKEGK